MRRRLLAVLTAVVLLSACGTRDGATHSPAAVSTTSTIQTSSAAPTTASSTTSTTSAPTATPRPALTATAQPAPPTATPVPIRPVKLQIPAIAVQATVEQVGLTSDGAMDVPKQWNDVGWYEYGPVPGQPGNAAIDGHLDSTTAPAIFWRLDSLNRGDKILITLSNGQTVTFLVTDKATYPYDQAPIQKIFGPASAPNLNLITCGGSWDAFTHNYSNRIVVYATKG